jgi:ABC-type phosphate transport system substrate-binding protein
MLKTVAVAFAGFALLPAFSCLDASLTVRTAVALDQEIDPALKPYAKVSGEVAGSLKCVGSDTMNNLVALWAEGFKKFYPSVQEGIEGKGSASAPPALTEGTSTFGPMSRDWKPSEIDTFKAKHGYPPTVVPAAIDMLAVFVHRDNPLKSLTLQQVDAIFSKNRTGGATADIRTWGDLGLEGDHIPVIGKVRAKRPSGDAGGLFDRPEPSHKVARSMDDQGGHRVGGRPRRRGGRHTAPIWGGRHTAPI